MAKVGGVVTNVHKKVYIYPVTIREICSPFPSNQLLSHHEVNLLSSKTLKTLTIMMRIKFTPAMPIAVTGSKYALSQADRSL
jgi:hypothetical protein